MEKQKTFLTIVVIAIMSFGLGRLSGEQKKSAPTFQPIHPEISVIHLQKRQGDSLIGTISGPTRIVWNESNTIETEGKFELPIGQIPNELDLALTEMPYTGNAKTNKFYPSNSYPARGVEVKNRRLFGDKAAAIKAGFIASKLVK